MTTILTIIFGSVLSLFSLIFNSKKDEKSPNNAKYFNKLTPTGWILFFCILFAMLLALASNCNQVKSAQLAQLLRDSIAKGDSLFQDTVNHSLATQLIESRQKNKRDSVQNRLQDSILRLYYTAQYNYLKLRADGLSEGLNKSNRSLNDLKTKNDSLTSIVYQQSDLALLTALRKDSIQPDIGLLIKTNFETNYSPGNNEYKSVDSFYLKAFNKPYNLDYFNFTMKTHLFPNHLVKLPGYSNPYIGSIKVSIGDYYRFEIAIRENGGVEVLYPPVILKHYENDAAYHDGNLDISDLQLTTAITHNSIYIQSKLKEKLNSAALLDKLRQTNTLITWRIRCPKQISDGALTAALKAMSDDIREISVWFPYDIDSNLWYEVLLRQKDSKILYDPQTKDGIITWNVEGKPQLINKSPSEIR